MAEKQSRGKTKSGAGGKAGRQKGKKGGLKLKDLDAKHVQKIRGGMKVKTDGSTY